MPEHPNAVFAREAFDAIAGSDVDWLQAHMHEDVVFHQGGRFPTAVPTPVGTPCSGT